MKSLVHQSKQSISNRRLGEEMPFEMVILFHNSKRRKKGHAVYAESRLSQEKYSQQIYQCEA